MLANLRTRLKGWRTILVAAFWAAAASLGWFLEQVQGVDLTPILPAKYRPMWPVAIALSMIVLRFVTTGPVGKKE
jgi:hypothetical protein